MSDEKTIFKKIIDGEIPADVVYEDEHCLAFRDIAPKAPVHILVIPKQEIVSIATADKSDQTLLGHLLLVCQNVAKSEGLDNGFRVVANSGPGGGQEVMHLHFHVMGGRDMNWPPG